LVSHSRDLPRKGHWRPPKKGSKIDEYLGIFSLNKHDLGLFLHDGEAMGDNKRGYSGMVGRVGGSFRTLPAREKQKNYQIHPVKNTHIF
jgi:hypothetical protein